MWRGEAGRLAFDMAEGQKVLAWGRISVYEGRGEYQLVASRLEPLGQGALQLAFEQLKRKLEAEGLFDEARKRPLPAYPHHVVVITSPTGAVIQDILNITARRCPWVRLSVIGVRVQGEGAAREIAAAIKWASREMKGKADLLLLARGGGSIEDLWAFNEELVARAIAASSLPVISAVGHEVDYTIADFVADLRAPTPSAAAELLSPSGAEIESQVHVLTSRARRGLLSHLRSQSEGLAALGARLKRCHPSARLAEARQRLDDARTTLSVSMVRFLKQGREQLAAHAARLQALSPLAILARGFAAVFDSQGRLLKDVARVKAGDALRIRLGKGQLDTLVQKIFKEA